MTKEQAKQLIGLLEESGFWAMDKYGYSISISLEDIKLLLDDLRKAGWTVEPPK